jgi:stress response protein SCP2
MAKRKIKAFSITASIAQEIVLSAEGEGAEDRKAIKEALSTAHTALHDAYMAASVYRSSFPVKLRNAIGKCIDNIEKIVEDMDAKPEEPKEEAEESETSDEGEEVEE